MLQSVEIRCSLCHSMVTDPRAVAEGQAGEAAAVPGYRHYAGISDLRQHRERQTLEVWITHHLRRGKPVLTPDFSLLSVLHFLPQTLASHLCDAAVGELGACREVQLLQPVES